MPAIKHIWITGSGGQLGKEFYDLQEAFPFFKFFFTTHQQLSITHTAAIYSYIIGNQIDLCINCAAYTAVDLAEKEQVAALEANAEAPGKLASICEKVNVQLVHFSTDYVFNGGGNTPYSPSDKTDPVNSYGQTKLAGENAVSVANPQAMIVRTSWVYSNYGKNFLNTMLRLMSEKEQISVVDDQYGSPTYAADLALAILRIAEGDSFVPGIHHYTNGGITTWFHFAVEIKKLAGSNCNVKPIPTSLYPTPAKRPAFSGLDTSGFPLHFGLPILPWQESLANCLARRNH
ncbi:MAG: dTDP-4-dehydrorhamnose reductase [Ferruginibacter sp.]